MAYLVHSSCRDGLHDDIGSMESLTSLPAELFAAADPSVRGAAPLLRPDEAVADSAGPLAPFDAVLALLAVPLPAGQGSPLPGKDLPAPPLVVAAAAADARPEPAPFAASATNAALLARLRLAAPEPALSAPSTTPGWASLSA